MGHLKVFCNRAMKIALCLDVYYIFSLIDAAMAFHTSGSFTSILFADAIRHLLTKKHPGPALLILDGHSSHHDLEGIDL